MDPPANVGEGPRVGALQWGIKRSFLDYLAGLPDGQAALAPGTTAVNDRIIVFPIDPRRHAAHSEAERVLRFSGEVRFGGHRGMLFVRLAEPWLHLRDGLGELTVSDPFMAGAALRVPLVTFTVPALIGQGPWTANDVRLTTAGAGIFNDVYAPGELLDPLVLTR